VKGWEPQAETRAEMAILPGPPGTPADSVRAPDVPVVRVGSGRERCSCRNEGKCSGSRRRGKVYAIYR